MHSPTTRVDKLHTWSEREWRDIGSRLRTTLVASPGRFRRVISRHSAAIGAFQRVLFVNPIGLVAVPVIPVFVLDLRLERHGFEFVLHARSCEIHSFIACGTCQQCRHTYRRLLSMDSLVWECYVIGGLYREKFVWTMNGLKLDREENGLMK